MPLLQLLMGETGKPQLQLYARAAFGPGYVGKIRKFRLMASSTLDQADWQLVPGWESIIGDNLPHPLPIEETNTRRFYKAAAWLE